MDEEAEVPAQYGLSPMGEEQGAGGYHNSSGYVMEEFLKDLRGRKGRKMYREMLDNDAIIGGMMFAIISVIRAADWTLEPSEGDAGGAGAAWMEDTIKNMPDITWDQVIEDALSMLGYGFAVQEIVTRLKEDGTVGLRKLAPRSQETIEQWEIDDEHDMALGVYQRPPNKFNEIHIPLTKCVHYKTTYARGNPEGRSMLRNAYKPYHFIKAIQISEAIGAERDLVGLPVIEAPSAYLADATKKAELLRLARDMKFNEQGGMVIPSDTFQAADGSPTGAKKWEIRLLASSGSSKIDTDKIIKRHSADMARTLLADFMLLGTDGKGSHAQSENKSNMFLRAVEGILENISQTLDMQLTPLLWRLNGFDPATIPKFRAGRVSPVDLQILGDFVSKISAAGIPLNDLATEDFLRHVSGLPPTPAEGERIPLDDETEDDGSDPAKDDPKKEEDDEETKKRGFYEKIIDFITLKSNAPAPVVNITNTPESFRKSDGGPSVINITMPEMKMNFPAIKIQNNIPEQKAGDITVNVPEGKAPNVNVSMPDVKVTVENPAINVTADIKPNDVNMKVPARKMETTVQYDNLGNVKSTHTIEKDLE